MAELRRRKADDEAKLDENLERKSEQDGAGTDGGAGTDDDSKQHQHKRKTSSGLNTAESSDHVNILSFFLFKDVKLECVWCLEREDLAVHYHFSVFFLSRNIAIRSVLRP